MNLISSTRLVNNLATRGQTTQPLTNISVTIMDFNERFRDILFLNVATLLLQTFFETNQQRYQIAPSNFRLKMAEFLKKWRLSKLDFWLDAHYKV